MRARRGLTHARGALPRSRWDTHDAGPSSVPVPAGDTGPRALSVLEALREYRVAEAAMQRRTRPTRDMNESDLLALRHLLDAEADGAQVRQKDLAVRLGMSSAAATSLVDRLVRSGHITREPDPADRRAVNLLPMPSAGLPSAAWKHPPAPDPCRGGADPAGSRDGQAVPDADARSRRRRRSSPAGIAATRPNPVAAPAGAGMPRKSRPGRQRSEAKQRPCRDGRPGTLLSPFSLCRFFAGPRRHRYLGNEYSQRSRP